jgi:phosphohistidine phosphatase
MAANSAGRVLWVLRHAKTLRRPPVGGTDHERVLGPRGRRDADALGRHLRADGDHLGLSDPMPELVLCSTAARTVATTERVLSGLENPPPVSFLRALYSASPLEVLEEISAVDDDIVSVMVVGHNPTFESLAASLPQKTDRRLSSGFPTCALAVFRLPMQRWDAIAQRTAVTAGVFCPPY